MPDVSGAGIPSRSQIEAWDTAHLESAAAHWSAIAPAWEEHYSAIHAGMLAPGGTTWEGTAADAAQERAWADLVKVRGLADCLHDAAETARTGAEDIGWAKRQVLDAISEAEASNFTVSEDLSVTPPSASSPLARVPIAEAVAAQQLATEIGSRAQTLASIDQQVASKITSALAPLQGASFGDTEGQRAPVMQAAGFRFKQDVEENDQDPFHRHDNEPRTPIGPAVDPDTGAREPTGTGPGSGAGMRGLPAGVGSDWTARVTDNGKGMIYQKPGAPRDSSSVRIMDPGADPRYPNGYVVFKNQFNQPINLDGKPAGPDTTHIPRNPDGTYPIPKGWG
jgi:hypothetical protein